MFGFSNYSAKSNYYDNSTKLVIGKMTDETPGVAIGEFFGLKPKMYLYLIDDNSDHKKAKDVKKNVIATVYHININMFCWIRNVWDIWWIWSKVKIIE